MSLSETNYPYFWKISHKIEDIILTYKDIDNGARLIETDISLMGRILQKREQSKKLIFYTLTINGNDFQIISDLNSYCSEDAFYKIHQTTRLGDIIGVNGYIGKGKRGELSIFPKEIAILAPCLHDLPSTYYGVEDKEVRYSNRYLDMIINKNVLTIFKKRSQIVKFLRDYLDNKEFIEVETPVLSNSAGGATAKPFTTYHNAMKQSMFMRIAPELFLKQLVIGGMWKVYEIGKQFRNEDIDTTHNPEFTSCEAYFAGADYNTWIDITEDLISSMALKVNGTTKTNWLGKDIDLKAPYLRLDIMDTLEKEIIKKLNNDNFKLPNLTSDNAEDEYNKLRETLNIKITKTQTLNL
jgi:lysyl-tRNA synthetase class 2